MVVIVRLFYLLTSFLVVSSSPYKKYNQTLTQIGLKVRPVKETVESNTISESQVKYYKSQENQNNTTIRTAEKDKFLHYIWNLMEMAGNNLSPKPSNPHLFTTLTILLIPKNRTSGTGINTTNKRPYVVPIPERTPSTTKAVNTTLIPVSTTSIPVSTTSIPVSTTSKPVSTTSKSVSTTSIPVSTTTKDIPSTTERISTTPHSISTTEQYYDDEDTGRPIKFKDTTLIDLEMLHKFSRKMPDVEHGSIQYKI